MNRPWKVSFYTTSSSLKNGRIRVRSFSTKKQAELFMARLPSKYTAFLRYHAKVNA